MPAHEGPAQPLADLPLARSDQPRFAERRGEPGLVEGLLADPSTRVLEIADGRAPIAGSGRLDLRAPRPPDHAADAVFLGADEIGPDGPGPAYLLLRVEQPGDGWRTLREVGGELDDQEGGLLAEALSLANWHASHRFCPRCGAPTEAANAGWTRVCTQDGSEHYPRTDPAVIMSVVDEDDRLLLGHGASWPQGRLSTLAGFVEPGESLEAAVRREVFEEVGVRIGAVHYRGSQPWPFPASVMLGFRACATTTDITVDGVEVDGARWFTRDSMVAAIASGELLLSPSISIARRLIEDWFGGLLPSGDAPG